MIKTISISITLPADILAAADEIIKVNRTTRSAYIKNLILDDIKLYNSITDMEAGKNEQ